MSEKALLLWSARFLIIGGFCLAIGINIRTGFTADFSEFDDPFYLPGIFLVLVGTLMVLIPFPIMYAFQADRAGKIGFIGFILSFMGLAAFNVGTLAINFILPVLAVHNEQTQTLLASEVPPFPLYAGFSMASMLVQTLGFIFLGIGTFKAKFYSRLVPSLFILGAITLMVLPIHPYNQKLGISLISVGLILAGNHINNEAYS
jgi:hypothetical protein